MFPETEVLFVSSFSERFLDRSDLPVILVFDDKSLLDYGSGNGGWM